jgi:hypothetical protein
MKLVLFHTFAFPATAQMIEFWKCLIISAMVSLSKMVSASKIIMISASDFSIQKLMALDFHPFGFLNILTCELL